MSEWLFYLKPTRLEMVTVGSTPEEAEIVGRYFASLKSLTEKGVMTATLYPYKVALMRKS